MTQEITFKIVGPDSSNGLVDLEEFTRFCISIQKCLRAAEAIVAGDVGKIEYRIVDLKCESATVKVEAVRHGRGKQSDPRKAVISFFRDTVRDLEKGKVDQRMAPADLDAFRELSEPLKRNAKRVIIGRTFITHHFDKTIGKVLDNNISSEGSVTGVLARINVRDRNEFIVYPSLEGGQVTCTFPESMVEEVGRAVKKNVTVSGTQVYRIGSPLPSRVHVKKMDVHPMDSELPSLSEVRRLGKWGTGNLTAVEFVRALRDE